MFVFNGGKKGKTGQEKVINQSNTHGHLRILKISPNIQLEQTKCLNTRQRVTNDAEKA